MKSISISKLELHFALNLKTTLERKNQQQTKLEIEIKSHPVFGWVTLEFSTQKIKMSYTFTMTQVLQRASEPFTSHLFTVAEFERMFFAGIFPTDTRAELLEGKMVILTPQNPPHKYALANYVDILPDVYGKRNVQMPQMPLDVHLEHYQPEPDLAILKPPKEQYKNRKNQAEDVLWLIEVSDATLETDRTVKLPIYAACGIPEYWIHDVSTGQLEVYTDPNKELKYPDCQFTFRL